MNKLVSVQSILEEIQERCKWNTMDCTDETDENGNKIFKAPNKDDYNYEMYETYQEVISLIEKKYFTK